MLRKKEWHEASQASSVNHKRLLAACQHHCHWHFATDLEGLVIMVNVKITVFEWTNPPSSSTPSWLSLPERQLSKVYNSNCQVEKKKSSQQNNRIQRTKNPTNFCTFHITSNLINFYFTLKYWFHFETPWNKCINDTFSYKAKFLPIKSESSFFKKNIQKPK